MTRAKRHYITGQIWHITHMVRAGVVKHPGEWPYSGCTAIQQPKRKKILINYEKLKDLLGFDSCEHLKTAHKQWVESCLSDGDSFRDGKWTESIAVGSEAFIQNLKVLMGGMVLGRKVLKTAELFQLKEDQYRYIAHFGAKKAEIDAQSTYVWDQNQ